MASNRRSIGFLNLPYDIRLQIYRYCLPQGYIIDVSPIFLGWPYLFEDPYVHSPLDDSPEYLDLGNEYSMPLFEYNQSGSLELACNSRDTYSRPSEPEDENPIYAHDGDQTNLSESLFYGPEAFNPQRSALPSLLQVCQQVSDEALDSLYSGNIFKIVLHGGGQYHLGAFSCQANRQRIRQVMLVLRPMGVSYKPGFKMDTAIWETILPHLQNLLIVAEEPLEDDYSWWNGKTVTEKMKIWIEWLTPILEYLHKMLSPQSTVLVDVNEREETSKLIQKYFSHRCRRARTKTGDMIFKKGEFSIESGYWDDYDDILNNFSDIYDYGYDFGCDPY